MSSQVEQALGRYRAALSMREALERTSRLITDRNAAEYGQTQQFADLVTGLKKGKGCQAELDRRVRLLVYARAAGDVQLRPRKSARVFVLPPGTVIRYEKLMGEHCVVARGPGGQALIMRVHKCPHGVPRVQVLKAYGFFPPSGRSAGKRGGGSRGPRMDKSGMHG